MLVTGNARHGERFTLKSVVCFKKLADPYSRIHSGLTLDISQRGICLFSPTLLEEGDSIRLWLLHPNGDQLTCVQGRIAWTAIDDLYGDSPYWVRAGIAFSNLNDEISLELTALLPVTALPVRQKKIRKHLLAVLP